MTMDKEYQSMLDQLIFDKNVDSIESILSIKFDYNYVAILIYL